MPDLDLSIRRGEVHIWRVPFPMSEDRVARLSECLNSEEHERSKKLHSKRDRHRFVSARGALRTILGLYLNERPDALTFTYGADGKPFLGYPYEAGRIAFNLSHCRDMAVIAITARRFVGVDVETVQELPELEDIITRHFSSEERARIQSAEGEAKYRLFFHVWTRREATAKARGLGLAAALSDLGIPFYPPGSGARLEQEGESTWWLQDLQLGATCIGAVCVEGPVCDAVLRDFEDTAPA